MLHETIETDTLDEMDKQFAVSPMIPVIRMYVEDAERSRLHKESQWLQNINNQAGLYQNSKLRETEAEDVFITTTSVKVRAAFSQLREALLTGDSFPIEVSPTPIPTGISEFSHLKGEMDVDAEPTGEQESQPSQAELLNVGFSGDDQTIAPGATQEAMKEGLIAGWMAKLKGAKEDQLVEGKDPSGGPTLQPAKQAAKQMEKIIQDQLLESKAKTHLRKSLYDCVLLGTGIIRGPFNVNKTINRWIDGEYAPEIQKVPRISRVSPWDLYIDPSADTFEDADWVVQRHRMTERKVKELMERPHFDIQMIKELLAESVGNYVERSYETQIRSGSDEEVTDLYEVLEFWGYIDTDLAREEYKLDVPQDAGMSVQVNMWISGDKVLRVVVNPFLPQRIPYMVFPYEVDSKDGIYGTGIPELMEHNQRLMNGFMRLAVENAAYAGSMVFEVDESMLAAGEDFRMYPGKIFRTNAGMQGTAVKGTKFPSTANENMLMFDKMRQLADEATGIPSVLHGQTGVAGTGRTASGLAMLMQTGSASIKGVIQNIDDALLRPLGQALFQWNMQFNNDKPNIIGDLDIKATGSLGILNKETQTQNLQTLLQLSANPALAPLVRLTTVVEDLVSSMGLDPESYINNPEEAQVYAALMGLQNMNQPAQGPQAPSAQAPAAGQEGFTGNTEGAGNPEGVQEPLQ